MSRWKKRKPVAILGCGPSGIFAAHALALIGRPFTIFSNKRASDMFGAQYLHAAIPGLSGRSFGVIHSILGTVDGYRRKVYGESQVDSVSPELFRDFTEAWDIRTAYRKGYDLYERFIDHTPGLTHKEVREIDRMFDGRMISTIPLPDICGARERHIFRSREVYAIGDAPERGIECPVRMPNNTITCNGKTAPAWYRASTILGYSTAEWPMQPPYDGAARVVKPVGTTCDCHKAMLRLGRYGTWTKGVLSHEAYFTVARALR